MSDARYRFPRDKRGAIELAEPRERTMTDQEIEQAFEKALRGIGGFTFDLPEGFTDPLPEGFHDRSKLRELLRRLDAEIDAARARPRPVPDPEEA